jgi:hypothetical protein
LRCPASNESEHFCEEIKTPSKTCTSIKTLNGKILNSVFLLCFSFVEQLLGHFFANLAST